jgi:hypothetical protein
MAGLGLLLIAYPMAALVPSLFHPDHLGTAFWLNCLAFYVVGWVIERSRSGRRTSS